MFLAYYDESGDDGYPNYSSSLFVLSATYVHYLNWKEAHNSIHEFRRQLKADFGLPAKLEFHTKHFLLDKNPFRYLRLGIDDKLSIMDLFCEFIGSLSIRIVNVAIDKAKVKSPTYNVLDTALTYSIQRIENDLNEIDPAKKFMIISDPGRIGKMRWTARKIQRFNPIPSRYSRSPYRQEIKSLIEDPLEKDSAESYFIQISDLVAYVVYLIFPK